MKNHRQWPRQVQRGGKSGCPQLLDIVSFILSYSSNLFLFSFNSSLAAMSDILIRLCDFLKKWKCMVVCCNLQIIIDHSEIDGVDKDGE